MILSERESVGAVCLQESMVANGIAVAVSDKELPLSTKASKKAAKKELAAADQVRISFIVTSVMT